jgi:YgiT-type zinc finger domain-containing protein
MNQKRCNFCGNKNFKNKEVEYIYRREGRIMLVNNVPCEECEYCGEKYYEAKTLKKIEQDFENIVNGQKKIRKKLSVPVEEYAELK